MTTYVLVRDLGCEGHSVPFMTMYRGDAELVLRALEHSYDGSLCVYAVPDSKEVREGVEPQKLTLADFA